MTSTPARRLVTAGAALGIAGAVAAYGVLILSTINAPPPAGLSSSGGIGLSTARPLTPNRSNEVACAGSFEPSTSFGRGPEGAWVVAGNGTGGFVGYRAAEILAFEFVRAPNDAVGRTTDVSGHLSIEDGRLTHAEVSARIEALQSDVDIRDSHISEFLGLRTHPTATFTLGSPVALGAPAEGAVVDVAATGQLSLLEVTRDVTFPLQARWSGDTIEVAGQLVINRGDYGMDIPQLLGFRVSEEITIELSLVFVRPGQPGCAAPAASSSPAPAGSSEPSPSIGLPAARTLERFPTGWGVLAFMGLASESAPGPLPAELFVLRGGAGAPRQITNSTVLEDEPAWSFDGRRIAYTLYPVEQPPELYVADADGSNAHQLVGGILRSPAWSPDGRYVLAVAGDEVHTGIVRVDVAAGTSANLIQAPGVEDAPAFSPDGRTIAFTLLPEGGTNEDIYLADADGGTVRRLTSDPAYEYEPRWSPDGRTIAFVRGGDLWLMRADGSHGRRLTSGLTVDSPTWSPDGKHLAFVISGTGTMNEGPQRRALWFIDADGSHLSNLSFDLFQVAHPAWRPG
jgi:polyisoprenoid-binding protein YceI